MTQFMIRVPRPGTYQDVDLYTVALYRKGDIIYVTHQGKPVEIHASHVIAMTVGHGGQGVACGGRDEADAMRALTSHYGWRAWEVCQ